MTTNSTTRSRRTLRRLALPLLMLAVWASATSTDDRGSDSSEKAINTLTAIAIATTLGVALAAFIAAKTGAFN